CHEPRGIDDRRRPSAAARAGRSCACALGPRGPGRASSRLGAPASPGTSPLAAGRGGGRAPGPWAGLRARLRVAGSRPSSGVPRPPAAPLWGDERTKGWTQSHPVDKDQRSTCTLDTGHGDGPLPGSAGPRIAALLTLLLASSSLGQRARRPPRPPSPISTIQPKANFDAQQFAGTWLLVAVASPCRHLQEQGHRAEATTLHAVPQGSAMTVSTFRKLDGICWAVRQLYGDTGRPGRFLLQARGARGPVDVVVGDTDYRGFAVLYLEQARQLSVKLYVRSLPVGDSFLSAFEQRVQGANLTEDHTLFFPKYGFCEAADQFHTLDEVRR
uniref:Uncharacterized protein n=1 Tax=Ovis aries TaxID=9940 RepID=A0AC11AMU1_SHEEP